jgi:hypothetical protein
MSLGSTGEVIPPEPGTQRKKMPSGWIVNVLCLCGAIIGIASVFCGWFVWTQAEVTESVSLVENMIENPGSRLWYIGALAFIAGSVFAFFTTYSGFVQVVGLVAVAKWSFDQSASYDRAFDGIFDFSLGLGFYMGVFSAGIVLVSIVYPKGPGHELAAPRLKGRLLVTSKSGIRPKKWDLEVKAVREPLVKRIVRAPGRFAAGLVGPSRRWASVLIVVMLASVSVVALDRDFFRQEPLLTQVAGGFAIASNSFTGGCGLSIFPWDHRYLSLSDGEYTARWSFSDVGLDDGTWCAVDLRDASIGPVNVSITVVERLGDGYFCLGDLLVLTAQNGTSFVEGHVYELEWGSLLERPFVHPNPYWEICFVFLGGELESWVSFDLRGILWL